MRKSVCLLLLAFTLTAVAQAQRLDTGLFDGKLPVQEKVYLHFDNNTYFLGDTIWYKAYVVIADDNLPQPYSKVLYVELLNEQGYLVERQQLVVDKNGQANGQFAIPRTAFAGFYEVRAYTKWMLNFGYGSFIKIGKQWYVRDMHGLHKFIKSSTPAKEYTIGLVGGSEPDEQKLSMEYFGKIIKKNDKEDNGNDFEESYNGDNTKIKLSQGNMATLSPEDILNGAVRVGDEVYRIRNGVEMDETEWAGVLTGDEDWDVNVGDAYDNGLSVDPDQLRKDFRTYNNLFSRVLPVYNRPDTMAYYKRRIMPQKITMGDYDVLWKSPEFNIKFYPEGGHLIEGVESRVGWEALDQELSRLNVNCVLYADGEILDTIKPMHAGRGRFTLRPQHGKKYKVKYISDGKTFEFNLPKVMKEGVGIWVDQDEYGVYVDVSSRFETPRQLYLSITNRGRLLKNYKLGKDSLCSVAIDIEDLKEGVNQATVYDAQGVVYSDRLFFVNDFNMLKGKVYVDGIANRAYKPKENIKLSLLATDGRGRPLKEQTFSVAIRDAEQLDNTYATGNIMTNLLLESEIKGFVETPDYYFESDDQRHRDALDLLLMIQGWRRYNWYEMARPNIFMLDFLPEEKMVIYGDVFSLRKNLLKKSNGLVDVFCSLSLFDDVPKGKDWRFQGHVKTDTTGNFHFAYEPFYGKAKLVLRGRYINKKDREGYSKLQHDPKIFIRKEYFYPRNLKMYSWYETHSPDTVPDKKLTWEDMQEDIYASEWIPQVTIKRKQRPHAKRQKDKPVYTTKYIDFLNDWWDRGHYNTFDLLDYQMTDAPVFLGSSQYVRSYNNDERWVIHYNWEYSSGAEYLSSYIPTRDSLFIVSDDPLRPTVFEYRHLDRREDATGQRTYGISGYVNLTTVKSEQAHRIVGREYTIDGFTRPAEFYNPDYSHAAMPEVKDYRRTLYWNPNVTTDKSGYANISFYNNSVCTELDVSAEGITRNGEFLIEEE